MEELLKGMDAAVAGLYEDLNEQDKRLVNMYLVAIHDASNKGFIVDDMLGFLDDDESVLEKMLSEIAESTINEVVRYMQSQICEIMTSWLDYYPEEEEE